MVAVVTVFVIIFIITIFFRTCATTVVIAAVIIIRLLPAAVSLDWSQTLSVNLLKTGTRHWTQIVGPVIVVAWHFVNKQLRRLEKRIYR